MLCVLKSDGVQQRLILDARRANCRFRPPPGVDLISGEGFGRVEVVLPDGVGPWSSQSLSLLSSLSLTLGASDVKDCFHRMRAPEWMQAYFCLPEVPAKGLDAVGCYVSTSSGMK